MDVKAALAHAALAVNTEGLLELVEMVGFRAKMAERIVAGLGGFFCGDATGSKIRAIRRPA